jgi:diacylglycerol kinase family enzyme
MDVGSVNLSDPERRMYFLGSMSLGLGTTVNQFIEGFSERHRFLSKNLFVLQTIAGGLGVFHSIYKNKVPLYAHLRCNQTQEQRRFSLLVFLNTGYYARGMKLGPDTSAFDGQIDCISLDTASLYRLLRLRRAVKRGNHLRKKEFRMIRSNRFYLDFETRADIQLDGDILRGIPACEVSVLPQALKVFAK